jgi:hypothetical protein
MLAAARREAGGWLPGLSFVHIDERDPCGTVLPEQNSPPDLVFIPCELDLDTRKAVALVCAREWGKQARYVVYNAQVLESPDLFFRHALFARTVVLLAPPAAGFASCAALVEAVARRTDLRPLRDEEASFVDELAEPPAACPGLLPWASPPRRGGSSPRRGAASSAGSASRRTPTAPVATVVSHPSFVGGDADPVSVGGDADLVSVGGDSHLL